jgi:predicted MFS family arabinose efflux permease
MSHPSSQVPFVTVFLLATAGFVSGASMRATDPLLPTLAREFGVAVADAAFVLTAFTFAYGTFQAIHGPLGDRFGKLRVIASGMAAAALAAGLCAFAPTLSVLNTGRFLTGMCAGAVIPLSLAFIGDRFPYEGRQAVLGRFIAGTLLGQSFGPLIGGVMSDAFGWRSTFGVIAAGFLLLAVLIGRESMRIGDRGTGHYTPPWKRYATILASPRARPVLATVGIEGILFFGALGFVGAHIKETFHLSDTLTGIIVAGFGLGGLTYSFLVKRLVGRLGEAGLVRAGGWTMALCFLMIGVLPSAALVAPFVAFQGFAFYMLHNTLQTRATEISPEARGAGVSLFAMCLFLGQAVGVALFGWAIHHVGYAVPFIAAGVALWLLAEVFRRSVKRTAAKART